MLKTILIVDDDILVLNSLEKLFNKSGYSVVRASNGKEALEKLTKANLRFVVSVSKQ